MPKSIRNKNKSLQELIPQQRLEPTSSHSDLLPNEILLHIFQLAIKPDSPSTGTAKKKAWSIDIQILNSIREVCKNWKQLVDEEIVMGNWEKVKALPFLSQFHSIKAPIKIIEKGIAAHHYLWRFEKLSQRLGFGVSVLFFASEYQTFFQEKYESPSFNKQWQQIHPHLSFQGGVIPLGKEAVCNSLENDFSQQQLQAISVLNLSRLQLSCLNFPLEKLTGIKKLDLSRNNLEELPLGLGSLDQLSWLSLNENKLNKSVTIWKLSQLTHLYLTKNHLKRLPKRVKHLTHLRVLDLSDNKIKQLPALLFQLNELQVLNLKGNQLEKIPPDIKKLQSLRQLNISSNQFQMDPSEVYQCSSLTDLNLSHNQLTSLHPTIYKLSLLNVLQLENNQLIQLPDKFYRLRGLQHLSLHENAIDEIPAEMSQLANLKSVTLMGNPIKQIPQEWDRIILVKKGQRVMRGFPLNQ